MVNAIVLLRVEKDRINRVAEEIAAFDGVAEVYSVAGQYDVVVNIRASDDDQIATLVTDELLLAAGIVLELPIAMVLLARILNDRLNRWLNIWLRIIFR